MIETLGENHNYLQIEQYNSELQKNWYQILVISGKQHKIFHYKKNQAKQRNKNKTKQKTKHKKNTTTTKLPPPQKKYTNK